jgi:hypothetical protein
MAGNGQLFASLQHSRGPSLPLQFARIAKLALPFARLPLFIPHVKFHHAMWIDEVEGRYRSVVRDFSFLVEFRPTVVRLGQDR